jgi:hypothetical protein
VSVLDDRIRRIAREEGAAHTGSDPEAAFSARHDAFQAQLSELEKEVARLRARLDEVEKAAATPAVKRATRKTTLAESAGSSE